MFKLLIYCFSLLDCFNLSGTCNALMTAPSTDITLSSSFTFTKLPFYTAFAKTVIRTNTTDFVFYDASFRT